jgi:hypothetical protein
MFCRVDAEARNLIEAARISRLLVNSMLFGVHHRNSRRSMHPEGAGVASPFERITHNKKIDSDTLIVIDRSWP